MKILIFLWTCLLLVSLSSCLEPLPQRTAFYYVNSAVEAPLVPVRVIHIWIDKNFGQADLLCIEDAIHQWSYALHGYLTLEIESTTFDMEDAPLQEVALGHGWVILKIDSDNSLVEAQDHDTSKALAFTEKIGGGHLYVVRDRIDNIQMTGIIMHEIGHLLGARHQKGPDNLMYPIFRINNSRCIDRATLQQVATYQGLPLERMNYCLYIAGDKIIKKSE